MPFGQDCIQTNFQRSVSLRDQCLCLGTSFCLTWGKTYDGVSCFVQ